MALASVVFSTARTLLNDDANTLFTDSVLAPKLTQAHRELQQKLRVADCPVMRGTFTGSVNANSTTLVSTPADLVEPIKIWEKVAGSSPTTFVLVTEEDPLDPTRAVGTTALQYWQWADEIITFRPAGSNNVDIKLLYWRSITIPLVGTDQIGIINGETYLAPRTAAIMAGSLGEEASFNALTEIANASLNDVIQINKGRLNPPGRS